MFLYGPQVAALFALIFSYLTYKYYDQGIGVVSCYTNFL